MNFPVVRQPIVDRDQNVFAYKLLARGGTEDLFCRVDGASEPIENAAQQNHLNGLQKIAGGRKCFINFNRRLLIDHAYTQLTADSTVVEVSCSEQADAELVNACRAARRAGYSLALDDFEVEPLLQPLLEDIDLLNVEFPILTEGQHLNILQSAKRYGFAAVAEHVNNQEDFARARQLGYTYFQGSYYCKPKQNSVRRLLASQMQYLRLLQAANAPDFQMDTIDELIRMDLSLTVRLLQYLNSPSFGLRAKVSSIRQAVGILGHRPLRKWVSLIVVSELSKEKPLVLMTTSLVRARFCEVVGELAFPPNIACDGFLVGMLSLLDAILDQPMHDILEDLALSPTVLAPLLRKPSPLSHLLDLATAFEEGDWCWIAALAFQLQLDESLLFTAYENAILWASDVNSEVG